MKRLFCVFALACLAAGIRPAGAAEIKIFSPADRSIVGGTVQFKIQPVHAPMEEFFENPDVSLQDEYGMELAKFPAVRDPQTGICYAELDTAKLKDGLYQIAVTYRTLLKSVMAQDDEEFISIGVRNGKDKPAKFTVELEEKEYKGEDSCDFVVKVYDQAGKLMPGARVALKVDKGELTTDAEISDSTGEIFGSVDSDDAQTVTLTITVENLPPVKKTVKFVE